MANYAIMRIAKRKLGGVSGICNHHERLKERYKSNPDIDPERTHLNYHLVRPEDRYRPLALKKIEESGAKMRKDSIVLQDCFIGASPDWIKEKSAEEQRKYFEHAFSFFSEKFGRDNIISAVVHMDEATPHMHLCFVPLTEDNRLSSKQIIGGPAGLVKLQDQFHAHMVKEFPDLTRGISKEISGRKHIPSHIFKQASELYNHYEEIVKAVNDIGVVGNARKKEEAIALLGRYAPEMAAIKQQIAPSEKYISELEERIATLGQMMSGKDRAIDKKDKEIEDLMNDLTKYKVTLRAWQKDLIRMKGIIEQIPPDVLKKLDANERARRKIEGKER